MAKWCRFIHPDLHVAQPDFGLIRDDAVIRVEGSPFTDYRMSDETFPLANVKLLPPVLPSTFFCVGMNYRAHILHAIAHGSTVARIPERPEIGYRANNALTGHGEAIVVPGDFTGKLEAEGEAVAIIGKTLRRCSRDEARDGIFGWTIGNDVSAREWQRADRTFWRSKNADTFKPMGPWIETDVDIANATTRVRIDGEEAASFKTGDMIFDHIDYIVEIAKYITLSPGDVLWMGADGNVEMRAGNSVEIEITGIGTLRNTVVAEAEYINA